MIAADIRSHIIMSDGIILDLYADDLDKEFVSQNQVNDALELIIYNYNNNNHNMSLVIISSKM